MNMVNTTEKPVMDELSAAPIPAVINIKLTKPNTIACPAMILAKRRIINAKGLVIKPTSSMIIIKGKGNFSQTGTSGQKMLL